MVKNIHREMFYLIPYLFCFWIQKFLIFGSQTFRDIRSSRLQAQAATLDDEGLQFLGVVGRRFHSINANRRDPPLFPPRNSRPYHQGFLRDHGGEKPFEKALFLGGDTLRFP